MISEVYREDRERRRLGSLTVYAGPTHSGKTKKLEAEAERATRQGRRMQRLTSAPSGARLLELLEPQTELVVIDDGQSYDSDLLEVTDRLATTHRVDVFVAGWELDYAAEPKGPVPALLCTADLAVKLDDGVCASPGCRNLASRTQRFQPRDGEADRFLPVCRRHHSEEARAADFQEGWFEEPSGSLDLISGCMFSGKTQELIRRLDQERYAGAKIQAFKPAIDDRYAIEAVASHRAVRFPAIAVPDVTAIEEQLQEETRVVGLDEAQFFGNEIVAFVSRLADRGMHVIVAGLDLDFLNRPFGPMPLLAAQADRLTKLQASCQYPGCGSHQATRTQRLVDGFPAPADAPLVVIGGSASYEARCRHHHRLGVNRREVVVGAAEDVASAEA
ncbi:MAG TPA: thymidine kinase [Candidatus Dormibacteraeota bacterium]|nr:thymidine kinase [Candidatus Dormibacteraeota bacterium]